MIDCKTFSLVGLDQQREYLALSYVWGKADPSWLIATKSNLGSLYKPNTLLTAVTGVQKRVPNTISDAIQSTSDLGFRFLWVDSLCIVQDNAREKPKLIQQMDDIYHQAYLTILSCDTTGSDEPIPGIGSDSAGFRFTFKTKYDAHCLEFHRRYTDFYDQIACQWNSRAWCFQEQCLS